METEGGNVSLSLCWGARRVCGFGVFGLLCSSKQLKHLFQAVPTLGTPHRGLAVLWQGLSL